MKNKENKLFLKKVKQAYTSGNYTKSKNFKLKSDILISTKTTIKIMHINNEFNFKIEVSKVHI